MNILLITLLVLICLRVTLEVWLCKINYRYSNRSSKKLPDILKPSFTPEIVQTSIDYLREKTKITVAELIFNGCLLIAILISGILKIIFNSQYWASINSSFERAILTFLCILAISLFSIPFSLYKEFVIEKKFGFSTMTFNLWIIDFLKGIILSFIIFVPVIALFIYVFEKYEKSWIAIFWTSLLIIQLFLLFIAPKVILPLFNKFEKLPDGELKTELINMTQKAEFPIASIEIMDESKRSKHSNAFFTGIGKNRKIVLFDTLLRQLSTKEIVAVVAHEIGHYKLAHIVKNFALSAIGSLAGLIAIDFAFRSDVFFSIFGITNSKPEVGLFIIVMLSHEIGFWFSPLINQITRKWEYDADKYAVKLISDPAPFKSALIKLAAENKSNIFPHPLFSKIYYSHPVLIERIKALDKAN